MTLTTTRLPEVIIVEGGAFSDSRGTFEVAWQQDVFEARGIEMHIAQFNYVTNRKRGTIRGMHYQLQPHAQAKLIRPIRGAVFDVAVDIRPNSPTFRQWVGVELRSGQSKMLYVPPGFAHGYQTLSDDTEIIYIVSTLYSPAHQVGIRWDDPAVGVRWPLGTPSVIHERDASYAYL